MRPVASNEGATTVNNNNESDLKSFTYRKMEGVLYENGFWGFALSVSVGRDPIVG